MSGVWIASEIMVSKTALLVTCIWTAIWNRRSAIIPMALEDKYISFQTRIFIQVYLCLFHLASLIWYVIFACLLCTLSLTTMLLSLLSLLATLQLGAALCYNITSVLVTSNEVQQCNNIQGATLMCCATNRGSSSSFTADTCLPNGLCQNVFTNQTTKKPDTNYWRESCSDSGWNSKFCLKDICWGQSVSEDQLDLI